ncbi:SDR family oxidoreductase [Rhodovulum sp. DZ06]|uniref:SDR family oxidoreductase n=1 Tax=Rhodovulum sp. DZ06 TaxID=3425126 RepID=UPI003D33CE98
MGKLDGKTAWITGGGTGIGEAAAKALAEAGAHVIVSGRRAEQLERVVADIAAAGGSAEAAPLDATDAGATEALAAKIEAARGAIDLFMANAGTNVPNRAQDSLTPQDFAKVVDVNLNGVMYGVLAVLPGMRKRGAGTLILTSSWAGRHASRLTGAAYNASKHGVVALSHSINMENAKHGIRCTALMPGEAKTPILDNRPVAPSPEEQAKMLQPEDLGDIVRFIAEAHPRVCLNEILVSPTWNRLFVADDPRAGV